MNCRVVLFGGLCIAFIASAYCKEPRGDESSLGSLVKNGISKYIGPKLNFMQRQFSDLDDQDISDILLAILLLLGIVVLLPLLLLPLLFIFPAIFPFFGTNTANTLTTAQTIPTVQLPINNGRRRRSQAGLGAETYSFSNMASILTTLAEAFKSYGVDNEQCQLKVVCQVNKGVLKPFSEKISDLFQSFVSSEELRKLTRGNKFSLKFQKFIDAASNGVLGLDCNSLYDKCTKSMDNVFQKQDSS